MNVVQSAALGSPEDKESVPIVDYSESGRSVSEVGASRRVKGSRYNYCKKIVEQSEGDEKTTDVTKASDFFLFGEIHPFSICRPQFGVHMEGNNAYHVPGNYHGKPSNFAFTDGHAEAHRWNNPKFNDPGLPEADAFWHNHETPLPRVTPAQIQTDVNWLRLHTTELR